MAIEHYKSLAAADDDIKELGKPYDLVVQLGGVERHVEVNGSSMLIDAVELTINEVTHGQACEHVDLAVVDGMTVVRDERGTVSRPPAAPSACGRTGRSRTRRSRQRSSPTCCLRREMTHRACKVRRMTVDLPANCPPDGHVDSEGTFFRLCESRHEVGEATAKGSWRKAYKIKGPHHGRTDVCDAHAFSLFKDIEVLQAARALNPWAANKAIAAVELIPGMGRILKTPSELAEGHWDWWPTPVDLVPAAVVVAPAIAA